MAPPVPSQLDFGCSWREKGAFAASKCYTPTTPAVLVKAARIYDRWYSWYCAIWWRYFTAAFWKLFLARFIRDTFAVIIYFIFRTLIFTYLIKNDAFTERAFIGHYYGVGPYTWYQHGRALKMPWSFAMIELPQQGLRLPSPEMLAAIKLVITIYYWVALIYFDGFMMRDVPITPFRGIFIALLRGEACWVRASTYIIYMSASLTIYFSDSMHRLTKILMPFTCCCHFED